MLRLFMFVYFFSLVGTSFSFASSSLELNWQAELGGKEIPRKTIKLQMGKLSTIEQEFVTGNGVATIKPKKMGNGYLLVVKLYSAKKKTVLEEYQVVAFPGAHSYIEAPRFAESLGLKSRLKFKMEILK